MVGFRFRLAIIGVLCTLLAGCTALRLAYSTAPELLYWRLDGYVGFNETQSPRVRDLISAWFAWHRRHELPQYAELLARAQAEVQADTTAERLCEWWDVGQRRLDVALEHAIPGLAEVALSLTPEQLVQFEKRQAKSNREFRDDYLQADLRERLEAGVKRAVERAELVYGRISDAQRALIVRQTEASPFDPEQALAERRARQQDLLQILRTLSAGGANRVAAEFALRGYIQRSMSSPREPYRRYAERLTRFVCAAAAEIHNSTTPAQRQAGMNRFKGWEGDVRALAGQAP
jgi:hypothetical protein